jgi:glycosyltransferase involved in cell wall biosynthesis
VARWDPDKRWLLAVKTVEELKRQGKHPLLISRGGMESHRHDVWAAASHARLKVVDRSNGGAGERGLLERLDGLDDVDIVNLLSPLDTRAGRLLYRGANAILANSSHEPFGLVALETMAVGGIACAGGTGEDYVIPGWNALVLQTGDPREFSSLFHRLQSKPTEIRAMRRRGRSTASRHTWAEIIQRNLLPRLEHS